MPVSELVDCQVENDDGLEAEQTFSLAPSLSDMGSGVEVQSTDHEHSHHSALKNDPPLLDSVSDRTIVGILIEFIRLDEVGMHLVIIF